MIDLMLLTNDLEIVTIADEVGINRIFIDLEIIGKKERQGHLSTVISNHKIKDISKVKNILRSSELLVRVNPINTSSQDEIDAVIEAGADIVMLPMFTKPQEVYKFLMILNGRARSSLLLETPQALARIKEILKIDGICEVHIGLNDLHLGMGLDFMFELVSGGIIDYVTNILKEHKIKFGFGGIGRVGTGLIPAEEIIKEHVRLGSELVILSRTFRELFINKSDKIKRLLRLTEEITKIRDIEKTALLRTKYDIERDRINFIHMVNNCVNYRG